MRKKYCGSCDRAVKPAQDGDCPLCGGGLDVIPRETCDNHPARLAVSELGAHMPRGDGTSGFRVSRRLCKECRDEWRKHNITVQYID